MKRQFDDEEGIVGDTNEVRKTLHWGEKQPGPMKDKTGKDQETVRMTDGAAPVTPKRSKTNHTQHNDNDKEDTIKDRKSNNNLIEFDGVRIKQELMEDGELQQEQDKNATKEEGKTTEVITIDISDETTPVSGNETVEHTWDG